MKKPGYVLDSFAVLAYFQGEAGGIKVKDILKKASSGKVSAFLSVLNLGEIIYITERRLGRDTAESILGDILRLPIQLAEAGMDRAGCCSYQGSLCHLLCGCIRRFTGAGVKCDHCNGGSGIQEGAISGKCPVALKQPCRFQGLRKTGYGFIGRSPQPHFGRFAPLNE